MGFPLLLALTKLLSAPASDAPSARAWLRALEGTWRGTYNWTGARTDRGEMNAAYRVTGNGSALIEDLVQNDKPVMTTVYHLNGNELRMTHYCAAGNQPRLKARSIDLAKNVVRFDFVDITNAPSLDAPHVHGFTIHRVDANHLELEFLFLAKGNESVEHIQLERVVRG
jgi:hypothetical protein